MCPKHTPQFVQPQLPFDEIPYGYCHCGCGEQTKLAPCDRPVRGWIKGQPQRFINNHHTRRPLEDRFWEKVDKNGPVHPVLLTECWLWTGSKDGAGYGGLREGKTLHAAHRFSYELHYGPIGDNQEVCHKCDNPPCVRGSHLFAGTRSDNMQDMTAKGRGNQKPEWMYRHGQEHSHAKLTDDQVREIRRLCADGAMQKDVAKLFCVHKGTVSDIVRRKNWAHL